MKKPPLFHVGQAVAWSHSVNPGQPGQPWHGPFLSRFEIYHVAEIHPRKPETLSNNGDWHISLVEVAGNWQYPEIAFSAVEPLPAEAYAELLEALEPVTA